MKKFFILIAAVVFSSALANAQDIITKKDGQDIKAKVLEVTSNEIKYNLYDEPNSTIYTIKKSEVLMIRHESGHNEVFNEKSKLELYYPSDREPVEGIVVGMKYNELKHIYDHKLYRSTHGDRYNPAIAGVVSFFIPGLGQMLCDEVGRGFMFLGANLGGSILTIAMIAYGAGYEYEMRYNTYVGIVLSALTINAGLVALNIYNIVDAVRVARVKNMYEQDLMRMYSLEANLFPSVNYTMVGGTVKPTVGLTLSLKF